MQRISKKFISAVRKISKKYIAADIKWNAARFLLYLVLIICLIILPFLFLYSIDRGYEIGGLAEESFSLGNAPEINILIMGDSLLIETDWVERFDKLLKKKYKFTGFNIYKSGKPGAPAEYGDKRIVLDLIEYHPDIVIIAFGTNDVNVTELKRYREAVESMVEKSERYGAEVFINFIGPFEPYACKEEYVKYNDILKIISYDYDIEIIDIHTPLMRDAEKYLADGIHYSYSGSGVVAGRVFRSITNYIEDEDILNKI